MRSTKILSSLLPLLALALPAQAPSEAGAVAASPDHARPAPVDVTVGAGLRPDGPGELVGGGTDYGVWFGADGMRFVPALGRAAAHARHVSLRPVEVRRGGHAVVRDLATAPVPIGLRAEYRHAPAVAERFDVGAHGVEVSWQFDRRPAGSGDLIVRYRLDTNLPRSTDDVAVGLRFVEPGLGGVAIGAVTGVDARGTRVGGGASFANGVLELSLPAAFVDAASYPIVLDPLVGPVIPLGAPAQPDAEPDIGYDATSQLYMVVWLRELAATLVLPRGRFVDASNTPVGPIVLLGSTGVCGRPRVANNPSRGRFGVVFEEQAGAFDGIQFRAVDANTSGAITHAAVLASSTGVGLFRHPDVCGSLAITNPAFFVVYEDDIQDAIRARIISFDVTDQLSAGSPIDVWTDSGGPIATSYTAPSVSRLDGAGLNLLMVARRHSGIGPSRSVAAKLLASPNLAVLGSTSFGTTTDDIGVADVDGGDGSWVVAWEHIPAAGATSIERRSIGWDGGGLTLGAIETHGGTTTQNVNAPSVGWSPARTWLGYRNYSGIGPQVSLRVAAIDSETSTWGGVELTQTISSADTRIIVATDASGGAVGGADAMATYAHGNTVYAQRLISYGNSGTYVSLGGQCGNGGVQYVSHSPCIGSSIVFGVIGLSPSALISVFNITPDLAPIACGTCEWAPFAITDVQLVTAGTASAPFVLPMLPSLIGSQWATQWTTWDPPQTPCALVPDFVLTERRLMTIGN